MKKTSKETYIFIGQNASTGTPHPITGRMSFWGTIYKAADRTTAKAFCEHKRDPYNHTICEFGSARKIRQYCLGSWVRDFETDLQYADTVFFNEDSQQWDAFI